MKLFLYIILNLFIVLYRKSTDFCKLILHPATLLKLFMVSMSFCVLFLGSLMYRIMSSENRGTLTVSLPLYILFIITSCLIAQLGIPRLC
jgi:hypothetical protein